MKRALVVLVAALAGPAGAAAHISIAPPFVESGVVTTISMTVPNERPPHATVAVRATMPPGISIASTTAPGGWTGTVDGATVTWSGGRIEGRTEVDFSVRVDPDVRAGTYRVASTQSYEDGATVRWKSDLIVLPASGEAAPDQRPWPAVAAGLIGLLVIGTSLLVLRRLRR